MENNDSRRGFALPRQTLLDVVDANDGATSLREAVSYYLAEQAAGTLPDGAKVCFDPNVFTQENHTIVLDAATSFYIDSSLVVDATDLGFNVVLDASMLMNQLFTVTGAKGNAALAGLTLENATCSVASSGSFIVKAGATLTLSSFRIANSTGLFRGGVYVNNATLIIEDSKFDQNYAAITGSVISAVNSSTVVVSNTIFEQNYSYIYGGAVELNFRSTATFTNCSFLDNTSATHGGAVYVAGNSSATFVGGEFVGNATEAANGEALYVAVGSDASLADVAFESNTPADMGGAGAPSIRRIWRPSRFSTSTPSFSISPLSSWKTKSRYSNHGVCPRGKGAFHTPSFPIRRGQLSHLAFINVEKFINAYYRRLK